MLSLQMVCESCDELLNFGMNLQICKHKCSKHSMGEKLSVIDCGTFDKSEQSHILDEMDKKSFNMACWVGWWIKMGGTSV